MKGSAGTATGFYPAFGRHYGKRFKARIRRAQAFKADKARNGLAAKSHFLILAIRHKWLKRENKNYEK